MKRIGLKTTKNRKEIISKYLKSHILEEFVDGNNYDFIIVDYIYIDSIYKKTNSQIVVVVENENQKKEILKLKLYDIIYDDDFFGLSINNLFYQKIKHYKNTKFGYYNPEENNIHNLKKFNIDVEVIDNINSIKDSMIVFVDIDIKDKYKVLEKTQSNTNTGIFFVAITKDDGFFRTFEFYRFNIQKKINLNYCQNHFYIELNNIVSMYSNIQGKKEVLNLLLEYKDALDKSAIVSKTDEKGKIIYVNDLFCSISGYSKKELIGSNHNIIRHPDMNDSIFKEMWSTIKSGKEWSGVIKNKRKDGRSYYVKTNVIPIINTNGKIKEFIAIRTDVSEREFYREILEEKLEASNNDLKYLAQYEKAISEFIAVIKTDENNVITYVNDNFCNISGYKKEELIGESCKILRGNEHIKNGDCDLILDKLKKKENIDIVFENKTKDGKRYFMDTKIFPFTITKKHDENLHLMHDVTILKDASLVLEETQKDIIYKLGEIGELRSKETANHVRRVAHYSKELGRLYGLTSNICNLLFLIAPIHDIGKVGIPDKVLNKNGKLSDDERFIMQKHPNIGYELLKDSKQPILKAGAIVAHQHHEKWDGTGYPRGLSGEDIHIYGRIVAIADVYDALSCERIYKKAWEEERIVELFKNEKGRHFDPKLIDLFLNNLHIFREIKEKFKD